MGFEGYDAPGFSLAFGLFPGNEKQFLMAAMQAIKVSDRHHGMMKFQGNGLMGPKQTHSFSLQPRDGTNTVASPSTTILPFTSQWQANWARRLAISRLATRAKAFTVSPMRTGARNRRFCDK